MRARLLGTLLLALGTAASAAAQAIPSPSLLVGEKSGGLLTVIDPATLQVVAKIPANRQPHEVATHDGLAYVSNAGARSITVIDLAARAQRPAIELGALGSTHGLWMSGGKLYFANEGARTIGRYDPAAGAIDWVLGTGMPGSHLLVVSDDGSRIFTANGGSSTVGILERGARGEWTLHSVPAGLGVEGLDVSHDGRELWAINVRDRTITVVDLATKSVAATLPVVSTYSNRLKFTPDGRYVLVSDFRGTDLMVYDVAARREVRRIDVGGGAEGVLIAPDGRRAYVAVSATDRVAVIDLETLTEVGSVAGLDNPDGMAWYVAP